MPAIKRIAIVGDGNVGSYLARELGACDFDVQLLGRSARRGTKLIQALARKDKVFDLVLLCVSDDAIPEVSAEIPALDCLVAHVSGATGLHAIDEKHSHRAVFYPLMSLTKETQIGIEGIPFCLETEHQNDLEPLNVLVEKLGARAYEVNSEQRTYLHLAAVLVHNFSNHLYQMAFEVLQAQDLDFKMLLPLLKNALSKLEALEPKRLQTGPAVRDDRATIQKHLELMENEKDRQLYTLLSERIKETNDQKL